jgi:hypothetical protein
MDATIALKGSVARENDQILRSPKYTLSNLLGKTPLRLVSWLSRYAGTLASDSSTGKSNTRNITSNSCNGGNYHVGVKTEYMPVLWSSLV